MALGPHCGPGHIMGVWEPVASKLRWTRNGIGIPSAPHGEKHTKVSLQSNTNKGQSVHWTEGHNKGTNGSKAFESSYSWAEILNSFNDLLLREPRVAQPHHVMELVPVDRHGLTTLAGHLALRLHPHKVAAIGLHELSQAHLPELFAHDRTAVAKIFRNHVDVAGQIARLDEVDKVARREDDGIVATVDEADVWQGLKQLLVGLDPSNLTSRSNELGEGADGEDTRIFWVIVVEEWLRLNRLEIQKLVCLVGSYEEVVLLGKCYEFDPLGFRHGVARGIVVHRHRVDHLDLSSIWSLE